MPLAFPCWTSSLAGVPRTYDLYDTAVKKNWMWIFDAMLYANVPIVFGLMAFFFFQVQA